MRSDTLKTLLADIRQHPGYQELLRAVEKPRQIRYRPNKGMSVDTVGAEACFIAGQVDQHRKWLHLLTGDATYLEGEE